MKYTIKDSTEETYCDWCGRPLLVGDKAIASDCETYVFCCDQDKRAFLWEMRNSPDYGLPAQFEYITPGGAQ